MRYRLRSDVYMNSKGEVAVLSTLSACPVLPTRTHQLFELGCWIASGTGPCSCAPKWGSPRVSKSNIHELLLRPSSSLLEPNSFMTQWIFAKFGVPSGFIKHGWLENPTF